MFKESKMPEQTHHPQTGAPVRGVLQRGEGKPVKVNEPSSRAEGREHGTDDGTSVQAHIEERINLLRRSKRS